MTRKIRFYVLALYDLFLAFGAIYLGIKMICLEGSFVDYPKEWLSLLPFTSWVVPGILAISFYGLGNIVVAVLSVLNREKINTRGNSNCHASVKQPWLGSAVMGGIFFVSLVAQVIILQEVFLATSQFLLLSILQLALSGYAYLGCRRTREQRAREQRARE